MRGCSTSEEAGRYLLRDGDADAVLVVPAGTAAQVASGGRPTAHGGDAAASPTRHATAPRPRPPAGRVVGVRGTALPGSSLPRSSHGTIFGEPEPTQLDILGPVFIGFFAYFLVFILTGISFLRESAPAGHSNGSWPRPSRVPRS